MTEHSRSPVYYGWVVVAVLGLVLGLGVGITFYGVSIYLSALSAGGAGFSLTTVSWATGGFLLASGVSGLAVARALERFDPRVVIGGGLVLAAIAVLALGRVAAGWQLALAYGSLGVGFAAISVIPASQLVSAWFERQRPLAMALTFSGLPAGGAVVSPAVARLVEARGVDGAGPWLAGCLVLVAGPLTLLLRPDPSTVGLGPDGTHPAREESALTAGPEWRDAVRSRWFLLVTAALTLGMLSQLGALTHLYNTVVERLDPTIAAATMSTLAGASLAGRLVGGWLLGRWPLGALASVLMVVQTGALLGLALLPGAWAVFTCAIAFGVTVGNMQVLQPLILAEHFGQRDFARILARSNLYVTTGMAAGPVLVGVLHDLTGGYRWSLAVAALPALLGAALMTLTRYAPDPGPAGRQQRHAAQAADQTPAPGTGGIS